MARHVALNWYNTLQAKLSGYPAYMADIIIFAPLGFIIGFLLESLGRYLLVGLLMGIGLVWLADYFHLITLHQAEIQSFFGFPVFYSFQDFSKEISTWAHEHVAGCIAFGIGFLLGWKLGL